ncbi:MAG: TrkA family potassium uptake protein [Chloroflexi bacterium]|nr:TrkA family potassium uptake protein [Chloroflexota bacterium]
MFVVIAGGGKAGRHLARLLLEKEYEVMIVEQDRRRYQRLNREFEDMAMMGDATEIFILERAGIERADVVAAVTGDDEDNIIICQVARYKFGVSKTIARVNNPENQEAFDVLGVKPTVSATMVMMSLIEHEMPTHRLVHLLNLQRENLEIVEAMVQDASPLAGKRVEEIALPAGSLLISILRDGTAMVPQGATELHVGDQILAILETGKEDELMQLFHAG